MQNNTVHKWDTREKYIAALVQMAIIIVHNKRKQSYNYYYKGNYVGDWYLLRAKFTND